MRTLLQVLVVVGLLLGFSAVVCAGTNEIWEDKLRKEADPEFMAGVNRCLEMANSDPYIDCNPYEDRQGSRGRTDISHYSEELAGAYFRTPKYPPPMRWWMGNRRWYKRRPM